MDPISDFAKGAQVGVSLGNTYANRAELNRTREQRDQLLQLQTENTRLQTEQLRMQNREMMLTRNMPGISNALESRDYEAAYKLANMADITGKIMSGYAGEADIEALIHSGNIPQELLQGLPSQATVELLKPWVEKQKFMRFVDKNTGETSFMPGNNFWMQTNIPAQVGKYKMAKSQQEIELSNQQLAQRINQMKNQLRLKAMQGQAAQGDQSAAEALYGQMGVSQEYAKFLAKDPNNLNKTQEQIQAGEKFFTEKQQPQVEATNVFERFTTPEWSFDSAINKPASELSKAALEGYKAVKQYPAMVKEAETQMADLSKDDKVVDTVVMPLIDIADKLDSPELTGPATGLVNKINSLKRSEANLLDPVLKKFDEVGEMVGMGKSKTETIQQSDEARKSLLAELRKSNVDSAIQDLVAKMIQIRSGAAVTDSERALYNVILRGGENSDPATIKAAMAGFIEAEMNSMAYRMQGVYSRGNSFTKSVLLGRMARYKMLSEKARGFTSQPLGNFVTAPAQPVSAQPVPAQPVSSQPAPAQPINNEVVPDYLKGLLP